MADSILTIEEIIERMLDIFKLKYTIEKGKHPASLKAPILVDEHFMFGNPAIIPQNDAVVVFADDIDTIDSEGGISTESGLCCAFHEALIHVRWYHKDHEQARGHRVIYQMGEILKRILLRNKRLVLFGDGLIHGLRIERIILGEQIRDAYEGNRVHYPSGDMLVRVFYAEGLDPDLIP